LTRRVRVLYGVGFATALAPAAFHTAHALPPPAPPRGAPPASAAPTIPPEAGKTLPYGSQLDFVLDDKVNSGTIVPGTTVHMHLRKALIVNGVTLAEAGAPATFSVITARKAHSGDEDGAIQIHLDPLALPGRNMSLPVRAYHEYLTVDHTTGQLSTLETTDTIADIFIPGHVIYHALRSGRQMVLPAGSVLRAETDATIDASVPSHIVFSTPPPFVSHFDAPHADLTAPPFYTPAPARPHPLPKGKSTLPPSPVPTPTATDAPSASASVAPPSTTVSPTPTS
jgi:hypothetical protein